MTKTENGEGQLHISAFPAGSPVCGKNITLWSRKKSFLFIARLEIPLSFELPSWFFPLLVSPLPYGWLLNRFLNEAGIFFILLFCFSGSRSSWVPDTFSLIFFRNWIYTNFVCSQTEGLWWWLWEESCAFCIFLDISVFQVALLIYNLESWHEKSRLFASLELNFAFDFAMVPPFFERPWSC